jgi:hypothetical protein
MYASTLFCRIVPQERGRGWMLLVSWEKPVIQRTCAQLLTLSGVTEASLAALKEKLKVEYRVGDLKDVTPDSTLKQLAKEFKAQAAPAA